ncbi:MAG: tetratricopeptide repeat protein [Candidatus Eremiobacteraeota bacterium]|nr:tetratricopeptide repeat protein [Candidatus Eremiobacteraeota bacterium]
MLFFAAFLLLTKEALGCSTCVYLITNSWETTITGIILILVFLHFLGLFIRNPSEKENFISSGQGFAVIAAFPVIWVFAVIFFFSNGPFTGPSTRAFLVPTNSASERSRLISCKMNMERIIAGSLERYASDNKGRYPESLNALMPAYLKELPRCPAGGIYVYRKEKGDFLLECSGEAHKLLGIKADYPRYTHSKGLECSDSGFSDLDMVKAPPYAYALIAITLILSAVYFNSYLLNRFFLFSSLISAGVCLKCFAAVFFNILLIPLAVYLYISFLFSRVESLYSFYKKRGAVRKAVFWLKSCAKFGRQFNRSAGLEANFYLGKIYEDAGQKDAALHCFELVLEENPQHPLAARAKEEIESLS